MTTAPMCFIILALQNYAKERDSNMESSQKAVITVIGKDMVGILAKVTDICAKCGINVLEVTQSILQDMFVMVMLVDMKASSVDVAALSTQMDALGQELCLKIHVMHEDIFNSMHKI